MSDSRNPSQLTIQETLDSFHAQVVTSKKLDDKYTSPLCNRDKVDYVCNVLGLRQDRFDLHYAYPLQSWLNSHDLSLLRCGLYLTDMRQEFFDLIINGAPEDVRHDVWEDHAEAEFWCERFQAVTYRRATGEPRPAFRVYH